jgi:DNA-binding beta-propeller fold protein YncE
MAFRRSRGAARRHTVPVALAGALVAAALASGCSAQQKLPVEEVVWPAPPEKPRIKYVRTIVGSYDFDQTFMGKFRRNFLGPDHSSDVFNPASLALSPDEQRLYVACPPVSRVLEFDLAGQSLRRVAAPEGHAAKSPYGVAVGPGDELFVTDQAERAVLVYSRGDRFLRQLGKGRLVRPSGIAIDAKRQLVYVVDAGTQEQPRHVVEVFAPDGRHVRTIGGRGQAQGQFLYPSHVLVGKDGLLYVSDTANSRVQAFDPDGNPVQMFGTLGDAGGQFGKPKGIAFDAFGNMHVVDSQTSRVQIFNTQLQLLLVYGGQAARHEFMLVPNGIAITSKNDIFVADYAMNHVNQYQLFNTKAEDAFRPAPPEGAAPAAPPPASPGP